MKPALTHLFSPIRISGLELKNRAVMPPMGTAFGANDSTVTDRLVHYLARRARGGAGLIIMELCAVDPRGRGFPSEIGIWSDDFIPGLSRVSRAVHDGGAKAALQIHHAGRESFKGVLGVEPEAPSAIPSPLTGEACVEMTADRAAELVECFAAAAGRAREAGFDAVEIHGAHGYLVGQFLSPFSNSRSDLYGGSDENRARFALEIVSAARRRLGPEFPIIFRLSSEELIRGGYDLGYARWLAPRLADAGASALHVSVGVYTTPGNLSIASMDTPEGFNLGRACAVRETVNIPVIAVGRIHDPRLADEAIARGDADLVSFGRQHLADPDFLAKAERGEFDRIRWCLACNQGCIERLTFEMKSAACSINPECGNEYRGAPVAVSGRKRVWVIGAGPAGLSAALEARARGCEVEIFERETGAGGQLRSASRPPNKEGFARWVSWAVEELGREGTAITFGREVTRDMLASARPDAVVVAAGSLPAAPPIEGIGLPHVADARDVLLEKYAIRGPAVVLGAGYVGMETADFLLARGVSVTIIDMSPFPPVGKLTAHGYWLHRRLKDKGGTIILGAQVTRVEQDAVVYMKSGREVRVHPVSLVVTALGARSEAGLAEALTELGIPHLLAGDAVKPRRLFEAVHEGARAGREV